MKEINNFRQKKAPQSFECEAITLVSAILHLKARLLTLEFSVLAQ